MGKFASPLSLQAPLKFAIRRGKRGRECLNKCIWKKRIHLEDNEAVKSARHGNKKTGYIVVR